MKVTIDPRLQLVICLLTIIMALSVDVTGSAILMVVMLGYMLIQGYYRQALHYLFLFVAFLALYYWIGHTQNQLISFIGFTAFLMLRMIPILMAGASLSMIPTGKLIASLQSLKIPQNFLITLAISLRFLPVLTKEYQTIQVAARQRGVAWSQPANWWQPLRTFEYTIVPLLFRCLTIAEELAASGTTKGITAPVKRTSYYEIKTGIWDWSVLLIFAGFLVFLIGGSY